MDIVRTWRRLPTARVDLAIAVAVFVAELVNAILRIDDACSVCDVNPWRVAVVAGMSLPLIWRRTYPMTVFVVIGVAAAYNGVIDAPALNVGILVAVYSTAAYGTAPVGWTALGLTLAAIVAIHLDRGELGPEFRLDLTAFFPVWLLGKLAAARVRHIEDLELRAEFAERDRDQRSALAVADERRRIARELHDIVAHGMSVMVVHAENAREALVEDPGLALRSLDIVTDTGRSGITELRRVLGILRDDEQHAPLQPQPTLAELPALVTAFARAGLPVQLETVGDPRPVPHSVATSAHRIVQEALTNALRHAEATRVGVTLTWAPDTLTMVIENDGAVIDTLVPGHGLTGIAERAEALGGHAAFDTGDGFRVTVTLPVAP